MILFSFVNNRTTQNMANVKKYVIELFDKDKTAYLKEDEQSKKEEDWIVSKLSSYSRKTKPYELLELGCGGGFLQRSHP